MTTAIMQPQQVNSSYKEQLDSFINRFNNKEESERLLKLLPNYDVIILNKRQQQQVVKSCGFVCFFFKKKWCSNQLSQKRECHVQ